MVVTREYQPGDEDAFEANAFSRRDNVDYDLSNPLFEKMTLVDGEEVKAVIVWFEFEIDVYAVFILASDDLVLRHVRALKRFMEDAIVRHKAHALITYSENCQKLDKWHRLMGFNLEVVAAEEINGKEFNRWVKYGH